MNKRSNQILILALVIGVMFHLLGSSFTFEKTYDAFVHIFFADHYMKSPWDPWEPRWYTGFLMVSYPPLVHQIMAIFALFIGLKISFVLTGVLGILIFITGVYRTTRVITGQKMAGSYAALAAALSTAIIEALHVYGQLPTLWGISLLLHMLPEMYRWIRFGYKYQLLTSLLILATTVASHHVTIIFGMIFFIPPMMSLAIMDRLISRNIKIGSENFIKEVWRLRTRIAIWVIFAVSLIFTVILPYWNWSQNDPIAQVPIPHGSRENLFTDPNLGLIFFVIPWGILLLFLPYFFSRYFTKRNFFLGLSLSLLMLLGTGGTTPIPKIILGEYAYNILTLERFTFWATILCLPLMGELIHRFVQGEFSKYLKKYISPSIIAYTFIGLYFMAAITSLFLTNFRPGQPDKINMQPIVNFLSQDEHDAWRYFTLGFGDQMAWLSTQVDAYSIDGNYHSARRVPELTSRPVERLENSKFIDKEGLKSLNDILSNAVKYNLKYVFSNDKFYDPILHFNGWQNISTLENNIVVWEKPQIPKLPTTIVRKHTSHIHNMMWATLPLTLLLLTLILYGFSGKINHGSNRKSENYIGSHIGKKMNEKELKLHSLSAITTLALLVTTFIYYGSKRYLQVSPEKTVTSYYQAMDSKDFEKAYNLIEGHKHYSQKQFLLEIHTQDGLLNSYGKLKQIKAHLIAKAKGYAKMEAQTLWSTPMKNIKLTDTIELKRIDRKWKIIPKQNNKDIPSEQFFNSTNFEFYNHGRRKNSIHVDHFGDALDQPNVSIPQAHLVEHGGRYFILGEVQNVSNRPANLFINSMIYDENGQLEKTVCTSTKIKYILLPQERTSFMIELDSISDFQNKYISLFVNTEASYSGKYPYASILKKYQNQNTLGVEVYNYGSQEITIPQVLISTYDQTGTLVWLESASGLKSIKPKRKQNFRINFAGAKDKKVLDKKIDKLIVNNILRSQNTNTLSRSESIKIELNPFVGNEK